MRTSLAHHKGRDRQGNREIIWNHTGWMLLLLLLMWENDWICCIIHFSQNWGNITEMFSVRLDYTKSWLVIWINSFPEAFIHLSSPHINPFPPSYHFIFSLLQILIPPSIFPFLHLFISLSFKVSFTLFTQALFNLHIPCFHHFTLPLFPSFHLSPIQDGYSSNWDLLKMSLLTDWERHSTALLIYPSSVLQ